jgi:hypothetical protein
MFRPRSERTMHYLFDTTERYFQDFYAALSALHGVAARFTMIFPSVPADSMKQFLLWTKARYEPSEVYEILEVARAFRGLLEHPNQHQMHSWNTLSNAGAPRFVEVYGAATKDGRVPDSSRPTNFTDGLGWFFAAPFDGFVTKIFGFLCVQILLDIVVSTRGVGFPDQFPLIASITVMGSRNTSTPEIKVVEVPSEVLANFEATPTRNLVYVDSVTSLRWHPRLLAQPARLDRYSGICLERDYGASEHEHHTTFRSMADNKGQKWIS